MHARQSALELNLTPQTFLYFCSNVETVPQAGREFVILLPQPVSSFDYRPALPGILQNSS